MQTWLPCLLFEVSSGARRICKTYFSTIYANTLAFSLISGLPGSVVDLKGSVVVRAGVVVTTAMLKERKGEEHLDIPIVINCL